MNLTPEQFQTIKAAILADPTMSGMPNNSDGSFSIAALFNLTATPDFFVWRTAVARTDIYKGNPQPENSVWVWGTYKSQSVTEQGTWREMFMGDELDFSSPNNRAGVAEIFQGSAAQNTQRAHVLACGRRKATRLEKLLSTGTGTTVTPATLGVGSNGQPVEGTVTYIEIYQARAS